MLVITHRNCPDGFGAAWAAWRKYPDAEFWFAVHGTEPPNVSGKDVVITDFCYPRTTLLRMKEEARSLIVLDHHKTAKNDCGDLDFCRFDMSKSGAVLSWEYFHTDDPEPPTLLEYIQYRDLGFLFTKKDHPLGLNEILAAVDSYPRTFEQWDLLSRRVAQCESGSDVSLFSEGEAILRFKNQLIDQLMRQAHEIEINGYKVKAINSPVFQSELGNLLTSENEFGVVWYQGIDQVKFSLRSLDSKTDVSKIAETYPPGGGHRNASGFSIGSLKLEDLLNATKVSKTS